MKFVRKKRFSLLVIFTLVVTIIAGCSGGGTPADTATQPPADQNKEAAVEPVQEKHEPKVDLNGRAVRISNWWDASPKGDSRQMSGLVNESKM